MPVEKTKVKHDFSNTINNYVHITNKLDYEFIELYEDDYLVTEFDKSDVIALCKILNITSEDLDG